MRRCLRTFVFVCGIAWLAACGANGAAAPAPQFHSAADASGIAHLFLGPATTTAALPVVAGIAGTIAFPAVDTPTALDLTASAASPAASAAQSIRHTSSDFSIDIYEYITLAPKTTVSFTTLPALSFTFPPGVAVNGKSVYFGITDPVAQPGSLSAFETEGPAKVVGQRATIGAVARPLVLQGGHRYTFMVYALSVPASVSVPTIYVANTGSANVMTYHANGAALASITAGLRAPAAVAVGPAGTIYVLDSFQSTVTSYAPNGTRGPVTIALPTAPHDGSVGYLGLDVGPDGTIDVPTTGICVFDCGLGSVLRFGPDGTPRPAIDTTPSLGVSAEALDPAGNIYVIGIPATTVFRYAADGSTHAQTVTGLRNATALAVDGGGRIYVVADQRIRRFNADGSATGLTIAPNFVPGPIAVDAAGQIYVVDPADGQIVTYNPDGSPAAPTITTGSAPAGIAVR